MCWGQRRYVFHKAHHVQAHFCTKPVVAPDAHVHVMLCVVVDDSIPSECRRELLQRRTAAAVTVQARVAVHHHRPHDTTALCAWIFGAPYKGTPAGGTGHQAGPRSGSAGGQGWRAAGWWVGSRPGCKEMGLSFLSPVSCAL